MPKRTVKQTLATQRTALPGGTVSAAFRRETVIREIMREHGERGDPLRAMARILANATDSKTQLEAARALAPFLYPQLKGVEVSGKDGESLTVQIVKVAPVSPQSSTLTPALDPGSTPSA